MAEKFFNEDAARLGAEVRRIRRELDITQEQLCVATSQFTPEGKPMRLSTISSIEKGKYNTTVRMFSQILAAMGYELQIVKKQS